MPRGLDERAPDPPTPPPPPSYSARPLPRLFLPGSPSPLPSPFPPPSPGSSGGGVNGIGPASEREVAGGTREPEGVVVSAAPAET